jgi:aldehyde dehydrogenase (NAD+)
MQEEIFGPLLPIIAYTQIDDVIDRINEGSKPLALYIWSADRRRTERIIADTSAGGTCINHQSIQFLHHNLPFGGVNNSGIGSYHGEWGVRMNFMLARVFFPPYTDFTRRMVGWILRFL